MIAGRCPPACCCLGCRRRRVLAQDGAATLAQAELDWRHLNTASAIRGFERALADPRVAADASAWTRPHPGVSRLAGRGCVSRLARRGRPAAAGAGGLPPRRRAAPELGRAARRPRRGAAARWPAGGGAGGIRSGAGAFARTRRGHPRPGTGQWPDACRPRSRGPGPHRRGAEGRSAGGGGDRGDGRSSPPGRRVRGCSTSTRGGSRRCRAGRTRR